MAEITTSMAYLAIHDGECTGICAEHPEDILQAFIVATIVSGGRIERVPLDVARTALYQPWPPKNAAPADDGWRWWGGATEEWSTIGPFRTRAEVIAQAVAEAAEADDGGEGSRTATIHLCEAKQDPLRLADWVAAEETLDRADEALVTSDRISSENDDGPWFEAMPEQAQDLRRRIEQACDEWQAAHGLVFTCATFSDSRNHETLVVSIPSPPQQEG